MDIKYFKLKNHLKYILIGKEIIVSAKKTNTA